MSRYIQGASHLEKEHELYQRKERSNKILIVRNRGILYSFLIQDNRICRAAREEKEEFPIGTIVLGNVLNVAKQFQGAFLALEEGGGTKGRTGFLQIRENACYRPVNRAADGRILCGDEIPVQIIKQAKGNKPPELSTEYSLAGQTVVVKKGSGRVTCSAKSGAQDKERLRKEFEEWKETVWSKVPALGERENASVLAEWDITFRTNAPAVKPEVWQKEITDLISQLEEIDRKSQNRTTYSKLYEPPVFYLDFIKEQRLSSLEEIVTDERDVYETLAAHAYTSVVPVRFYEDKRISLASVYALDTRLRELLSPKVYMRSGAYLMIEQTEALVAIDVNSGKAEKKTDPEEFYFRTNLEAVKEVCYQLSARNLSGMILVDFINMKDGEHTKMLVEALKEETAKDTVTTRFVDLTRLGLAEITRKKSSRSLQFMLRDWEWKK